MSVVDAKQGIQNQVMGGRAMMHATEAVTLAVAAAQAPRQTS